MGDAMGVSPLPSLRVESPAGAIRAMACSNFSDDFVPTRGDCQVAMLRLGNFSTKARWSREYSSISVLYSKHWTKTRTALLVSSIYLHVSPAMKNALEKKLQKLQAQKSALDAQIRHIEKERAQELRQLRHKKYSLIGKVILTQLEAGESLKFTCESDLLHLLNTQLISKPERQTFGLPYPVQPTNTSTPHNQPTPETLPLKSQKNVKGAAPSPKNTAAKKVEQNPTSKTNITSVLPSPNSQSELAQEFNL